MAKKLNSTGLPDAPLLEEIEPRILLSAGVHSALFGDALAHAVSFDPDSFAQESPFVSVTGDDATVAGNTRHELVFVDAATPDYQRLVDQLLAGAGQGREIDVIVIDTGSDGIEQISQVLMGYGDLDAVHIISHGTDGGVRLGSSWLNDSSVAGYANLISGWGDALGADADLLFYGCELAAGAGGNGLIAELAELTGADIAASNDLTGHAGLGGDWVLEYQTGSIESEIVFDKQLQQSWVNTLDVTVDSSSTGTDVNTDSITISHTVSGANRLILVSIASEPNGAESVDTITYNGVNLTLVGTHINATTNVRVEIWALVAPDTGTHNVVIDLTAQSKSVAVGVVSFNGVDQSTPYGTFVTAEGDSATASVAVASSDGDLVFGFAGVRKGIDATPGAGQTELFDTGIANIEGAGSTEDGSGIVTTSWALDVSDKWIATGVSINAAEQGLAVWNDNAASSPEFSFWNGTSFESPSFELGMPEWRIIQGAESPFGNEAIVVGVDTSNQVTAMIWNGSSWTPLPLNPLSTVTQSFWWGFDVQYEQQSGDAMLVWNNGAGGSNGISYSVWNGTAWSVPATIATPLSGEAQQMQLVANPNSDEMILVVSNDNSEDYALVWDGSGWGDAEVLDTGSGDNRTDINVAYEAQSGHAIVIYGQGSSNARYQIWNGAAWSAQSSITSPGGVSGNVLWVTMASDPTTDRIVLGVSTDANEMWLSVWDGNSWDTAIEASILNASGIDRPSVAVAFEGTSGEAVAAYSTNSTTVRFRIWTPGGGWSGDTVGPNILQSHNSIMLYADSSSDRIMLAVQDDGRDLHYALWSGDAWGAPTEIETDTNEVKNQPFLFLWGPSPTPSVAVATSLWLADQTSPLVEQFGGPGLALENPVTAGSFSNVFDLRTVAPASLVNINALHYVGSTISLSGVGITSMTLDAGDIIFSVDGSDTLGGVPVTNQDLIVFRPTTPGDYSAGTFTVLAAGLGAGKDITAFSLVESDTFVPGSGTLAQGDFIYVAGSGGDMRRIRHYDASTGSDTFILDGDVDATTGFKPGANVITGIDLIESDITIGGRTLTAGQILVTLTDDDISVGNGGGNISVTDEDIFILDLVSVSDFSASLLFDGSDVGYLGDVNALTLGGGGTHTISGSVFEDVNGDGILDDATGAINVDVHLYLDDGDGVIDAGDTWIETVTTDAAGLFNFAPVADGTYWIVVDSTTMTPDAGFNGGFGLGDVWAEQTWGSAGAVSFDGSYNYLGVSGEFYGGMQFEVSDDASSLTTAEHVTRAVVSGANATGVDSAFSFNAITRTGDGDDDPGANRSMQGSLRQFIQNSNAIAGIQSSRFAIDISDSNHYYYRDDGIAGSLSLVASTTLNDAAITDFDPDYPVIAHSWYRIQPTSALPVITDTVIIDGYTQAGASANTLGIGTDAVMKIEINGDLSGNADAFTINASSSELRGLVINGDFSIAIVINASNVIVSGNYIGTDITGTQATTNLDYGLYIASGASDNIIGGATVADRNVISGTTSNAIWILNPTTQGNTIRGNYIGTNAQGDAAIANVSNAIVLTDGTHDNTIQDNLISGNSTGIYIDGTVNGPDANVIIGNLIGTDASGMLALANAYGIWLQAGVTNTMIGGTSAASRNVISGNTAEGIHIRGVGTSGNTIIGNYIGVNASGNAALGNGTGVRIQFGATNNAIGGAGANEGNVISGNTTDGIEISGAGTTGNTIIGNYIGTDSSGTVALGNGFAGVEITNSASGNVVGGTSVAERNVIAANAVSGVDLSGGAFGNTVQGNYIGVDASGLLDFGSGFAGVRIISGANSNTIGGTAPGAGNVISGNADGIYIADAGTTGNTIQGNLIGTDASGTIAVGNSDDGIEIINGASGNLIGGSTPGARNVIAGNGGDGISISGAGTTGNTVYGNYIGVDAGGNTALANNTGIRIHLGAANNAIGGSGANEGNVISGNTSHGVVIRDTGTSGNTVEGNYIGTNAAGDAAIGNGLQGVLIQQGATGNTVGGTTPGARNVISGNLSTGVFIQNAGTSGNLIHGNYIGTDAAGTVAIANVSGGVRVSDFATGNYIGGAGAGEGNVISGNSWGVQIFADAFGNFVQGNLIGTDSSGTAALANTGQGVIIQSGANNNTIGGTLAGEGNVIAFNASSGVQLAADSGTGNSILGNSIHTNSGLGIEVMPWGVDANIVTLTSAVTDGVGNISIDGTITGASAFTSYRIEFFANVSGDPSGSGEGEIFLGYMDVVTDAMGNATFSVPLSAVIPPGYIISATATDPAGTTSEFAANITAVSLPPVLDLDADDSSGASGADYDTGFTEDGLPVSVADIDATLTDPDTLLQWLTVTITNLMDGVAELLAADTSGTGITAVYDSLTGVLTLTGADTAAHYQQVLRTITYTNSSDDPDTTTRMLDVVASDGGTASNVGTTSISITAVNDAPVLAAASPVMPSIIEDDTNNGGIQISTLLGGSVTDVDSGALQGIAVTGLSSGNGTWEYSTDGGLTWIAVGTVSDGNALLLRATDYIRFVPDGENADTASFDFRAWDQTSGSFGTKVDASLNGGASAFSTATDTASITTSAVNDAPVLAPAAPVLPSITEDDVSNGGIQISTLLGGSVTDVDSGAVSGIAVTGLSSGNGMWEYSTDGGLTWIAVGTVSDGNALLLRATDYIRFVPDGENADTASFDFRAWDQTSGSFGTKVDTLTNGGTSAFSSATDTAGITVTAVNDAPGLTPAAPALPSITEDDLSNGGIQISTLLGGSVSDADTGAVQGIAVTGLSSGNGAWEYSTDGGLTWIAVGTVSDGNALLLRSTDYIRFVPDGENADTASFDFRAWDQTSGLFGTRVDTLTNGGTTAFSSATDTAGITVTAVNDAPVLTPAAPALPSITEDDLSNGGIRISILLGGSVTDVDSGAVSGIAVTGLSSGNGMWEYSTDGGLTWIAVGTVSDGNALLLRSTDYIRFVPDGENADTASFDFRAWDQTSGSFGSKVDTLTNGGTSAFSSATDTAGITVTAVNDAPVLTPAAPALSSITEDDLGNGGIQISTLLGGSVSDVDTGAVQGIAVTGLSSGNGAWEYSTDGGLTWIAVGTVSDGNALLLRSTDYIRFVPDGENADTASFDFRAWDQTSGLFGSKVDTLTNGGTTAFSSATDTAGITVTAVNDAPVLTPAAPALPSITEDDLSNGGIRISILLGGSVTDVDSGAVSGIAVTGLSSGNGAWEYSTDGGLTWIAVGTVSDGNALLLRATDYIRFVPDGENADTASFDFRAWDQTSGSFGTKADASVNGGINAFSASSDTASITVTSVNEAPVLAPAAPVLPSITEDDVSNGGIQISALLGGTVTDVDSGALQGIAVTGLSSGNGTWEYSTDGGLTWTAVGAVADNNALLLRANDYIRFVPDGANADLASFDFRAWDQSSGSFGTKVDASVTGGTSAFSTASDTASLTITAVNDAPVLAPAAPNLPAITEDDVSNGGIQISILLGGSVTDVDSGAIQGIAVTGLSSGNGTWEYSTDGGLTWTAVGTVADNNALLLRANDYIRFVPDGANADSASFDFKAWDQTSGLFGTKADASVNGGINAFSAASDTASITVTSVNDAPVLTPAAPNLPSITEDDLNNGGTQIATLLGGSVTDVDSGASQGIAVTGLNSSNGTWEYSTDGGLTWTAVGTVADNNALLLRANDYIRFVPDGDNADSASVDFRAWDQSSGLFGTKVDASVNGGVNAFSASSDTASITVTSVNDAPVLTPAAPNLPSITEDDVSNGGIQISTLLGGTVTDVDSGALQGIAVTGLSSGNGTWEYSTDGGLTWTAVGTVADNNALLLRANDYIRFVPDGDNADSAGFDFRAWDQASGLFGTKVDASVNGGINAFSAASDTASITVTAANDAPVLTPGAPVLPSITEDDVNNGGIQIATLLGGSVTDVDSSALQGIAVTGLSSANGTWEYSTDGGLTWTAVGTVADNNALLLRANDYIRFVPDGANADSASFDFRAWDQTSGLFGTKADASVNGGINAFSASSDTASITVTSVNDAPVLTPAAPNLPSITEDDINNGGIQIATLLGGSVTDVDSGAIQGIAVTGLNSSNGTWEYSTDGGLTWTAVGAVADDNALLLRANDYIRFVPDGANADSASFDFRAWDQTSGLFGTKVDASVNGGISALSTATDTASITVGGTNDAPVVNDQSFDVDENTGVGASVGFVGASDPDIGDNLTFSIIGGNTDGAFFIDPVTGEITVLNALALNFETNPVFVLTIQVQDDGTGPMMDTANVTINLNNINEAPVNTVPGSAPLTNEDTAVVFSVANGNAIVIADQDAGNNPVQITLQATNGTMTLASLSGLTFVTGDGSGDSVLVFTGTVDDINAALDGLSFVGDQDFFGAATLQITTDDQGHTGLGAPLTDVDTINIDIASVNDNPETSGLADVATLEDGAPVVIDLHGAFSDIEDLVSQLTYSVAGNTDPSLFSNISFDTVAGTLTLDLAADASGQTTITIRAVDTDGALVESTFVIDVGAVNDAPFTSGPESLSLLEDGPATAFDLFSLFGDVDNLNSELTFSIISNDNTALTAAGIDATTGTLNLNTSAEASGTSTLTLRATDSSGAFVETSFVVTVNPVDDAVVNFVPGSQSVTDDQFVLFSSGNGNSISVTDIDSSNITVTLSVPNGLLTLGSTGGLTFSEGDGADDLIMTFTGSIDDVNAALDGLTYRPMPDFDGVVSLQIATWSPDLPLADRAPVSAETISILVLESIEPTPAAPASVDVPVENTDKSDPEPVTETEPDGEADAETSTADELPEGADVAFVAETEPDFSVLNNDEPVVDVPLPDSGSSITRDYLTRATEALLQLSADAKLPAFVISDAVWDAIDAMQDEMSGLDEADASDHEFLVTVSTGLTLTLSAGFVSWMMRAGSLLTSLLSTTPMWQRFDPLPVLDDRSAADKDESTKSDADAVKAIFGANK